MAELAWITLGKHPQLGLTASTINDDFGSANRLLLDAGFSTGHPDFAYVLGDSRPDQVPATLQQLYSAVASHYVAIDDASLDGPMPTSPAPPRGSEPANPPTPSPRRPDSRADLAEFAEELSGRLPGSWTAAVHEHAAEEGQLTLSERVWDYGHVSWALSESPHIEAPYSPVTLASSSWSPTAPCAGTNSSSPRSSHEAAGSTRPPRHPTASS